MRRFIFLKGFTKEWMTTEIVNGEVRRIRAIWTPELSNDLNAYHGIDAEAELTRLLSEQWAETVDEDILRHLREFAERDYGNVIPMTLNDEIETEDNDEIINEITRLMNGGHRA